MGLEHLEYANRKSIIEASCLAAVSKVVTSLLSGILSPNISVRIPSIVDSFIASTSATFFLSTSCNALAWLIMPSFMSRFKSSSITLLSSIDNSSNIVE